MSGDLLTFEVRDETNDSLRRNTCVQSLRRNDSTGAHKMAAPKNPWPLLRRLEEMAPQQARIRVEQFGSMMLLKQAESASKIIRSTMPCRVCVSWCEAQGECESSS